MFAAYWVRSKRTFWVAAILVCSVLTFQADLSAFASENRESFCDFEALASIPDRDRQPSAIPNANYPLQCGSSAQEEENVILKFDVRENGKPVHVEAISSTNKCFISHAIRAAKSWEYNCVRGGLFGVEVKMSFDYRDKRSSLIAASYDPASCDKSENDLDFATPLGRMPPSYPERCMYDAGPSEEVLVTYDVLPSGITDNIRVIKSTHECLNSAAVESVTRWKYKCSSDGKLNLETSLIFRLQGDGPTHKGVAVCYLFDLLTYKAKDIVRDPSLGQLCTLEPYYAVQCSQKAGNKEHVSLIFNVTSGGDVHEIVVDDSTNACFDKFAKFSLSQKKYAQSSSGYNNIGAVFVYEKRKTDDQ